MRRSAIQNADTVSRRGIWFLHILMSSFTPDQSDEDVFRMRPLIIPMTPSCLRAATASCRKTYRQGDS